MEKSAYKTHIRGEHKFHDVRNDGNGKYIGKIINNPQGLLHPGLPVCKKGKHKSGKDQKRNRYDHKPCSVPQGGPEKFIREKTGIIGDPKKTNLSHEAPFVEAHIDTLNNRPDNKQAVEQEKRKHKNKRRHRFPSDSFVS
jgi:hypothetical protein